MYWDVRLQQLAQKRAQLCSVENIDIITRQLPSFGVVIGENLAAGYEKWSHVLTSWANEKRNFVYKSQTTPILSTSTPSTSSQEQQIQQKQKALETDNLQSGHYTQMIYSKASRIGCGYAQCSNTTYDRYFVCYYGEM
jgi:hypothetical protein